MNAINRWLAAFASVALGSAPAVADPAPGIAAALGHPGEVTIPDTRRIDLVSSVNDRRYSIDIALPNEPAPPHGYRVIYVLDGHAFFASVTEAARVNPYAGGLVVVGIGYPHDTAWSDAVIAANQAGAASLPGLPRHMLAANLERLRDLTLAADEKTLA